MGHGVALGLMLRLAQQRRIDLALRMMPARSHSRQSLVQGECRLCGAIPDVVARCTSLFVAP